MKWQDKAAELKLDKGVSWVKLPQELEKIYGHPFTYDQTRNAVRRHPRYGENKGIKEGKEERISAIQEKGDYYIVISGKRSIESQGEVKRDKTLFTVTMTADNK